MHAISQRDLFSCIETYNYGQNEHKNNLDTYWLL